MKKTMAFTWIVFIVLFGFCSCNSNTDPAIEEIGNKGETLYKIHLDLVQDTSSILLSDLFGDISLIPLETSSSCILNSRPKIVVGDQYIVVKSKESINLFSTEGKFIRKIAHRGKGPGEFIDPNLHMFLNEQNNRLYISDYRLHRDKLLCINLQDGGHEYIQINQHQETDGVRDVIFQNDSTMIIIPNAISNSPHNRPIYCQTTGGELLWEVNNIHPNGLVNGSLDSPGSRMFFRYAFGGDTVYEINESVLKPFIVVSSKGPHSYFKKEVGAKVVGTYPISDHLFISSATYIERMEYNERAKRDLPKYSETQKYLIDTKNKQCSMINGISNDFLGSEDNFYLSTQKDGIGVVVYDALNLLEIAKSGLQSDDLSKLQRNNLNQIINSIDEEDNPILLIGRNK